MLPGRDLILLRLGASENIRPLLFACLALVLSRSSPVSPLSCLALLLSCPSAVSPFSLAYASLIAMCASKYCTRPRLCASASSFARHLCCLSRPGRDVRIHALHQVWSSRFSFFSRSPFSFASAPLNAMCASMRCSSLGVGASASSLARPCRPATRSGCRTCRDDHSSPTCWRT